jgi:inosose dehydratase
MKSNRRNFIEKIGGSTLATLLFSSANFKNTKVYPISCNVYNWITFYHRAGKEWGKDLEADIAEFAKTGILAIEPGFQNAQEVIKIAPILKKYNISMPSAYVNSILHKSDEAEKSIKEVLAIADEAKRLLNTEIFVTNPSPIRWGGTEVKSDAELIEQAKNLEKLGNELRKRGITLAYHTHDTEMLAGAREFHHILQNTSPKNVSFCFDTHWVFRGSQNSQVAVFDVLKMYGSRVVELHLRQSVNGIWSETFEEGDIDYQRFAKELKKLKIRPHLVIEQCIEDKSPNNWNVVEAHKKDLEVIKKLFVFNL